MAKKALVVGIDYYSDINQLHGCVNDAHAVKSVLDRHSDGTRNFEVQLLTASAEGDAISRVDLKEHVQELFLGNDEIALFYFAGHGHIEATGGYLCASDCKTGDDGLPLSDVLAYASASSAKNKIIVLDSCHSGIAGTRPVAKPVVELTEGTTILTASTADQYASEENGSGIFTTLFVDALNGGAANLVGDVTPGSVYSYIDQSLGAWVRQRPMFKTNVQEFVSLRKTQPPIELEDLLRINEFFPTEGMELTLDPSYEPRSDHPNRQNTAIFSILQKYNRVNLLVPVNAPHMYDAAMESKSCKLTVLGEHYRRLVDNERI